MAKLYMVQSPKAKWHTYSGFHGSEDRMKLLSRVIQTLELSVSVSVNSRKDLSAFLFQSSSCTVLETISDLGLAPEISKT